MQTVLDKKNISSQELEELLKAREEGKADFILVDVREPMEYEMGHIKGADMLKPTSTFPQWGQELFNETQGKKVIFTCRTGNRSAQVQHVFNQNGHEGAINHSGGIVTYQGEIER
ncbi:MAG: rhodanese-like domain-containing protein [Sulfurovum sp.]|nr:MAG: rhodanese-like domain-containing protein [Sulfurovum sp.]